MIRAASLSSRSGRFQHRTTRLSCVKHLRSDNIWDRSPYHENNQSTWSCTAQGATLCAYRCDRCFADPQTGVAPGVTQGRNVRSRYRCSMCPAIHINSRTWLRSSSTHEPSDPPLRVISSRFCFLRLTTEPWPEVLCLQFWLLLGTCIDLIRMTRRLGRPLLIKPVQIPRRFVLRCHWVLSVGVGSGPGLR